MIKNFTFLFIFFLFSCSSNKSFLPIKNTYENLPKKEINLLKVTTSPTINCIDNINYVDVDNFIFFSDCNNKIFSFNKSSSKLNSFKLPFTFPYGINVNDSKAFFVNENNFLLSYDLDNGNLIWKIDLGAQVKSVPIISNNQIFLNSIDGSVYSYDISSGKSLWIYNSVQSSLSLNLIRHSVLSNKKTLLTSFPGGKVVSLNSESGLELWSNFASFPEGDNDIERLVDFKHKPIIIQDFVCFNAYLKNIICFDVSKGTKIFEYYDERVVFFNQHDNYLIGVTNKDNLLLFDTFDNFSFKKVAVPGEVIHSSKINKNLCFITKNSHLFCVDPESMEIFNPSFAKENKYKNIHFLNNFLFLKSKNNKVSIYSVSQ